MTQLGVIACTVIACLAIAAVGGLCGLKSFRASKGVPFEGEDKLIHYAPTKESKRLARRWLAGVMACIIAILATIGGADNILGGSSAPITSEAKEAGVIPPLITSDDLVQAGTLDAPEAKPNEEDDGMSFADMAQATGEIPDVCNFRLDELEVEYGHLSRYYNPMCDNSMAQARNMAAQIYLGKDKVPTDLFALPLAMPIDWFLDGTMYERTDTPLEVLLTQKAVTIADRETIEKKWEELKKELAEMSAEELDQYYWERFEERAMIPQYQLALVSEMRENELFTKNNLPFIEKFFRWVAECNAIEWSSLSPELQKRFETEAKFETFMEFFLREPTEEEQKDGKDYSSVEVDEATVDLFMDELERMPLGIDRCVQYDPDHGKDFRYLMITDRGWENGISILTMMKCTENFGTAVMTTIRNWVSPEVRADDRMLEIKEADYQENVPDKNGKIQNPYSAWWRCFYNKDSAMTNRMFLGLNETDGRVMGAEPTAKPVDKKPEANLVAKYLLQGTNQRVASPSSWYCTPGSTVSKDPKNVPGHTCVNPNAGKNIEIPSSGTKTIIFYYTKDEIKIPDLELTIAYWLQGTTQKVADPDTEYHQPGAIVGDRYPKGVDGYTCVNPNAGLGIVMPGSGGKVIIFYYTKDNPPPDNDDDPGPTPTPTPEPTPDPTPTPTPTPTPDGQGGKTPTTDPGATGVGNKSEDVGANSGNGTGTKQDYNAEQAADSSIIANANQEAADRDAANAADATAAADKKDEQQQAASDLEQKAVESGEQGGITYDGNENNPEVNPGEINPGETAVTAEEANGDGTTITTTTTPSENPGFTGGSLAVPE